MVSKSRAVLVQHRMLESSSTHESNRIRLFIVPVSMRLVIDPLPGAAIRRVFTLVLPDYHVN